MIGPAIVWSLNFSLSPVDTSKPIIVEDRDVILKVTGSTVCGSDLHLLHGKHNFQFQRFGTPEAKQYRFRTGTVLQLEKGDVLGHEFCGVVESVGSAVKDIQPTDRVVASFQIACGNVSNNKSAKHLVLT